MSCILAKNMNSRHQSDSVPDHEPVGICVLWYRGSCIVFLCAVACELRTDN